MVRPLRSIPLALILSVVVARAACAQPPTFAVPDSAIAGADISYADTLRVDADSVSDGAVPSHESAITASLGFGAVTRGLMIDAGLAYVDGNSFYAARFALDPNLGRYSRYVEGELAAVPGAELQRCEADLVAGLEHRAGPLFIGVDCGLGVAELFNVQTVQYEGPAISRTVYYASDLPILGLVADAHVRLPLGRKLSLAGRVHAHFNYYEPVYGASLELHYVLGTISLRSETSGPDSTRSVDAHEPRHIVYAEIISSAIFANVFSLNYERILSRHLTLRAGIGAGYLLDLYHEAILTGSSGLVMLNYVADQDGGFELGFGVCAVQGDQSKGRSSKWWTGYGARPVFAMPAIAFGYRNQPAEAGLFLHTGLSWAYYYGIGLHFGSGYAF